MLVLAAEAMAVVEMEGRASIVGVLDADGVVLRQSAGLLVFALGEHRELPVPTWTVTPHALLGYADACEVDSGPGQEQFTAWVDALPGSDGAGRVRTCRPGGLPVTGAAGSALTGLAG